MTVEEAAKATGYAPFTIRLFCRNGELIATKPLGNRHGWDINRGYLDKWMRERRAARSNEAVRTERRMADAAKWEAARLAAEQQKAERKAEREAAKQ